MNRIYYAYILALWFGPVLFAQQIAVDNTVPVQQLIEDNLVDGCFEITNISSPVNGQVNGFSSYAYFERAGSNFPFENGIMLSTGDANSGGNTENTNTLNEGQTNWGTDPDLESTLGITNTLNATSIEFDFVSISNTIQFNYILASEEYYSNFPCDYSDGFAFLIKPSGSPGPYQNIALVPGTTIPVNTNTVHDEIVGFCPEENGEYFDGYNIGDTNYNGRTEVLTATASITPYVQYHIKLIIADQTDQNYDSAVFIEGNSFNSVVDLGEDITTCADTLTLDADIQNNQASYTWFLDGNPIPGETNPTLQVTESGTYSVEIAVQLNSIHCLIEDSIAIQLSSEQTGTPIADYTICDDSSGNEVETFDLSTKDAEVLASVPPATYTFSYHYTLAEAQSNTNAITTPIQNTVNPQTIHIRIEDLDSGCLAYSTLNLVVNELPDITAPTPLELCDTGDPDGFTEFDLTTKYSEITGGQSNMSVSYHYTQTDAENGTNAVFSPYTNLSPYSEQLFVRVTDATTGCVNTTTLTLSVFENPPINTDSHYIDACDPAHDGYASFDLNSIIDDVLEGLTGVSVTFHTVYDDALTGANPIPNPGNFDNTDLEEQVVYIRVVDDITGCASVTPVEVHSNLLLTGTQIQDFSFCDLDFDGSENIDLDLIANVIAHDVPNVSVTFYESQTDLDNGTNPVDTGVLYNITGDHTFYISITNGSCTEESQVTIIINNMPSTAPIAPIDYCDTNADGFTTVDLYSLNSGITSNPDYAVRYFATQADANNGINQLPPFYDNVSNPQTIYVRVEDMNTACGVTNSFELNIIPAPDTNTASDILICDADGDGFSEVNLNQKIPEIIADTTDISLAFFTSTEDAQNNTNAIATPDNFDTQSTPIVVRVESDSTGCYALETFNIIINTLPEVSVVDNFQLCEDDNDSITDFYLVDKDDDILNGTVNNEVLYFETAADAQNNTNPIDKFNAYQNSTSPQTLYIRVQSITDPNCFATGEFDIEVAPNPIFNEPTDIVVCDDISNDATDTFNLNDKITEITQGSPDTLDISFFETVEDAQNNVNALPLQYTNSTNPQQIYVRIQNQTYCNIITGFGINIIPSPEVSPSQPLEVCDDDQDGFAEFNLTDALFDILDVRQDHLEISYYESMTDLESQTNAIINPENYTNLSNPQTIYIRITNTVTLCYQAIPLDLIVHLPPQVNLLTTVEICDNEAQTYDLTLVNEWIVSNPNAVTITYYTSLSDAETGQNPITGEYPYTGSNTTLYVRVENETTGCFTTASFILQVNARPFAPNPAPPMEACDDNYDGLLVFDLDENTPFILAGLDPDDHTVTHYSSYEDAESGTNALHPVHQGTDGEIIYVRIVTNETGCYYVTQFQLVIHPLAVIDLQDIIPLCLDSLPLVVNASTNNAGDTYLWSTGETTASIDVYPEAIGTYWVTITTPFGCETTHTFEVISSEIATINFTTSVDFADPNSITVDVSGSGDYIFSLDHGPWQSSNVFENVSLGLHLVTVRDANGCLDVTQEVMVIDVPKFVTPNNDGYFDTWHIVGIDRLPGTIVYIYDRYGKLLKTLTHLSQGWNGTYRGNPMPADDYWFLASVKKDDTQFDVKGHFTLKR